MARTQQDFTYPRRFIDPTQAFNGRALEDYLRQIGWDVVDVSLSSVNWDGGDDLSGGKDATATQGFFLDVASGSIQAMSLFADSGSLDDLVITGGTITAPLFRTAASGARLEIDGPSGDSFIQLFDASGVTGYMGWNPTGWGSDDLVISTVGNLDGIVVDAHGGLLLEAGGVSGYGVTVKSGAAGGSPGTIFRVQDGIGSTKLEVLTNGTIDFYNGVVKTTSGLTLEDGAAFEIKDNSGNPYFRVVQDTATAGHNSIINAWANTSATAFHVGQVTSGAEVFRAVGRATVTSGQYTGARQIDLVSIADSTSGGIVRINQGGNLAPTSPGSGLAALSISTATTGRSVNDHQLMFGVTTVANVGWIQMVDPGIAYYTLALNPNGGQIAMGPGPYNLTTSSAANMHISSSTYGYNIYRSTSSRKYKDRIDYDYPLADIELKPNRHWRIDDEQWRFGLIAEDLALAAAEFEELGDDGTVDDYNDRAVMAVMAAKINRLEELVGAGSR